MSVAFAREEIKDMSKGSGFKIIVATDIFNCPWIYYSFDSYGNELHLMLFELY